MLSLKLCSHLIYEHRNRVVAFLHLYSSARMFTYFSGYRLFLLIVCDFPQSFHEEAGILAHDRFLLHHFQFFR
jgi:hypothetical protein